MLKLLLIAANTSRFTNNNYDDLEKELAKVTTLMVYRKSGHINKILRKTSEKPDFILIINDVGKTFTPVVTGLSDISIPVGLMVNDAHRFVEQRRRYITANHIRTFFVICQHNFYNYYPRQKNDQVFFLPQFANTSIFKDYGAEKTVDLMMLGEVSLPQIYPLREKILQHYKNNPKFFNRPHPGWRDFTKEQTEKALIGENYAKTINQAKLFFACGSVRQVVTFKYFEVPACKTLLMAPALPELKEIGLIPGKHFVTINAKNFSERAAYYLKNTKERERITAEGCRFVHNHHSTAHRARQLVRQIKKIL
ncbi:Spore maturation protein CgeB [Lentibacillus halodurans]|uniref:Spore maturation protein CgeB n=1 Tax=Lentibacillus halodurans TaxID=237679 RepID=A0A1I0XY96_9BACI|nr:glycosyltransferase [Lentibacillus halodurans]SFB06015.1 Spore maturation protein CgeB [Lentibacillus halodurans]